MYAEGITKELISRARDFHGHWCGGLALGIRAAAWAMEHFGTASDEEIVAVSETDMCGVDAIQALVGCTLGKGNLIFRDTGKVAFTFYRRRDGKSQRIVAKVRNDEIKKRMQSLTIQLTAQNLSEWIRTKLEVEFASLRKKDIEFVLSAPFEDIFEIKSPQLEMPGMARRLPTVVCDCCGEGVMASRIIQKDGRKLCADCAEKA